MTIKQIIRKLHLWIGMATGIVVFVVAVTGCIYVFSEELKHVAYKDRTEINVSNGGTSLPISILLEKASLVFENQYPCQRIIVPGHDNETISFVFEKTNQEAFWYTDYMEFNKTVYINPYSGAIVKVENTKWEFFNIVFWLHISLLLGYKVGSQIVTWSVVLFIFLLISGAVLWWPKKKKIKRRIWFRWKTTTGWRRKNYDLHQIPGFYVLLFGVIFSLTGLFWSSENVNKWSRWIVNGGSTVEEQARITSDTTNQNNGNETLDVAFAKVKEASPASEAYMIRVPASSQAPFIMRAYPNETNYDRVVYYFDQYSGQLFFTENFEGKNNGDKLAVLNYDLHVGSIGGLPTKILAFFASLIIASLPVTGLVIWLGRRLKKKKKKGSSNQLKKKQYRETEPTS